MSTDVLQGFDGQAAGMTVAVLHRARIRPLRSPRRAGASVLAARSGKVELAAIAALYGLYEGVRGFGSASLATARAHTADIVALEQHVGVFVERPLQSAVAHLPSSGAARLRVHEPASDGDRGMLAWVHRSHRERFAVVRTTLVLATAVSLAIYVLYPAAPPRLSGLGFADTVTRSAHVNLSSDALGSLYNPFAAVPSLHFGYRAAVGASARRSLSGFMLFTIVATGNHFFFDAAAGGLVVVASFLAARRALPTA